MTGHEMTWERQPLRQHVGRMTCTCGRTTGWRILNREGVDRTKLAMQAHLWLVESEALRAARRAAVADAKALLDEMRASGGEPTLRGAVEALSAHKPRVVCCVDAIGQCCDAGCLRCTGCRCTCECYLCGLDEEKR